MESRRETVINSACRVQFNRVQIYHTRAWHLPVSGHSVVLRSFSELRKHLVVLNLTSVIESSGGWKVGALLL